MNRRFVEKPSGDALALKGTGNVVSLFGGEVAAQPVRHKPSESERRLIGWLRRLFVASLVRPRVDFDKACFLIAGDPAITAERCATAFFHGLKIYGSRATEFYAAGVSEASHDEMWMIRLLSALQDQNYSTVRYLMALRVKPAGRRRLTFLAQELDRSIADYFEG
jgi:hypothetical protein